MSSFKDLVKELTEDFGNEHCEHVSKDQTDGVAIYGDESVSKTKNNSEESNSQGLTGLAIFTENEMVDDVNNGGQVLTNNDCDSTCFKEGSHGKQLSEVEMADSVRSEFTDATDDICLSQDVISSISNILHDSENETEHYEDAKSEMLVLNKSGDVEERVLESHSIDVKENGEPNEPFYRPKFLTGDLEEVKENSVDSRIGPFVDNRPICDCEAVTRLMSNTDARFLLSLLPDMAEMSSRQKTAFENRVIQLVERVYTDTNEH